MVPRPTVRGKEPGGLPLPCPRLPGGPVLPPPRRQEDLPQDLHLPRLRLAALAGGGAVPLARASPADLPHTRRGEQAQALAAARERKWLAREHGLHPIRDRAEVTRLLPRLYRDRWLFLEDF